MSGLVLSEGIVRGNSKAIEVLDIKLIRLKALESILSRVPGYPSVIEMKKFIDKKEL